MELTISYDSNTACLGIKIYRQSTHQTSQIYVKNVDEISKFIMLVKDYEPITIAFDRSVIATQKDVIKRHIADNVIL